jgi:undecaprenyl phosphate-alpha-L-ara4N flippase subunit ArnE
MEYVFLGIAILLITSGQVLQKIASDKVAGQGSERSIAARFVFCGEFWMAIFCLGLGTVVWLLALATLEVSKAYPMLSLSFVLTTLIARIHLKEKVSAGRWLGVCLICAGAALMTGA